MSEPMPRITIEPCASHARATFRGETVAESDKALVLRERGYPPRVYFPQSDVRMELLRRTAHKTHCPYKGDAAYWTLQTGDEAIENAAWAYPTPLGDVTAIAGHLSFVDAVKTEAESLTAGRRGVSAPGPG